MYKNNLTAAYVRSILHYDNDTGAFTWLERSIETFMPSSKRSAEYICQRWNPKNSGKIAGRINKGYVEIRINGEKYSAHRLAWLYVTGGWPKEQIDHIDGNPSNNCFINLREATNAENLRNRGVQSNNTSGVKGVYWRKDSRKWLAQISLNGEYRYLGLFDEDKLDEAAAAYSKAARELHGEFVRTE